MRFAKLEVKVIITLFLMQYDYELVDKAGKAVTKLPEPDRTNLYVDNYISITDFFLTRSECVPGIKPLRSSVSVRISWSISFIRDDSFLS